MPTEEFVLIPRNMFTTEQPQVSQILNNPLTKNKSKQLSLLQRTSKQEPPEAVIQQNTEQQTDDVMVSDDEEKQQSIPDNTKRKEFDEISQSVIDDIDFLDKYKFGKAKIILKKINGSRNISLDFEGKILINGRNTDIPASTFLYALQQTSSKLLPDDYQVLNYLNLAPHLTFNTYAKKFIKIPKEQKLRQFPDGAASEQKPAIERAEKTETASFDEEGFADAEEEIKTPTGWKTPFGGNQKTK